MSGGAWTERRIDLLKQLWAEGRSARFIAAQLGMSRSAVLGKVFRLRLGAAKKSKSKPKSKPKSAVRSRSKAPGRRRKRPVVAAAPPKRRGKTLFELTNDSCRWPFGRPGTAGFYFCGEPGADLEDGRPYCARHAARAYVKQKKGAAADLFAPDSNDPLRTKQSPSLVPAAKRWQRIVLDVLRRRA